MESFDLVIRNGSEEEKQELLSKYPHTRNVIRDGGVLILALKSDEAIGFLWMFKRRIPAPVDREEWFINVIDVLDESNRCKGIGSSLVKKAIEYAKRDGVYQIRAYCDAANVSSHMLWVKNGFLISPVSGPNGSVPGSFVGRVLYTT